MAALSSSRSPFHSIVRDEIDGFIGQLTQLDFSRLLKGFSPNDTAKRRPTTDRSIAVRRLPFMRSASWKLLGVGRFWELRLLLVHFPLNLFCSQRGNHATKENPSAPFRKKTSCVVLTRAKRRFELKIQQICRHPKLRSSHRRPRWLGIASINSYGHQVVKSVSEDLTRRRIEGGKRERERERDRE